MPRKPPPPGHVRYALGDLISRRRRERGFTQADLSRVLGVHRNAVNAWEHGLAAPPIDVLMRLAGACDMALSAFLSPLDDFHLEQLPEDHHHPRRKARKHAAGPDPDRRADDAAGGAGEAVRGDGDTE